MACQQARARSASAILMDSRRCRRRQPRIPRQPQVIIAGKIHQGLTVEPDHRPRLALQGLHRPVPARPMHRIQGSGNPAIGIAAPIVLTTHHHSSTLAAGTSNWTSLQHLIDEGVVPDWPY
jgi:hypothetical protein